MPTITTMTQYPEFSTASLMAPELLPKADSEPPGAVVPLGRVPLMTKVSVPLTSAILDTVEFMSDWLPFPMTSFRYVVFVF